MKDWIDDLNNLLPKGRVSISQEDLLEHSYDAWSVSIKTRQQGSSASQALESTARFYWDIWRNKSTLPKPQLPDYIKTPNWLKDF